MNLLSRVILFIANLNLGNYFFAVTTLSMLLASILLLIFSFTFKRLRHINKTILTGVTISVYLLCLSLYLCKIYAFKTYDILQLILCLAFALLQTITLTILCFLTPKNSAIIKENEVIGGYFDKNDQTYCGENYFHFSKNPFKKIERLQTKKMFDTPCKNDFNVNYSYVLKRINSLEKNHLSSIEKTEIFNLKSMIEQALYKELTEKERETLCDGIRNFLKISAKYDDFLQDKI